MDLLDKMQQIIISKNSQETTDIGASLASKLQGGEIISLLGDLGGGKTTFTQGLAAGLGIKETITSPTFVILKKYQVSQPPIKNLFHLDLYRIHDRQELFDLGWVEIISNSTNITIIEWADKVEEIIPPAKNLRIKFSWLGKNRRKIIFSSPEKRFFRRLGF